MSLFGGLFDTFNSGNNTRALRKQTKLANQGIDQATGYINQGANTAIGNINSGASDAREALTNANAQQMGYLNQATGPYNFLNNAAQSGITKYGDLAGLNVEHALCIWRAMNDFSTHRQVARRVAAGRELEQRGVGTLGQIRRDLQ